MMCVLIPEVENRQHTGSLDEPGRRGREHSAGTGAAAGSQEVLLCNLLTPQYSFMSLYKAICGRGFGLPVLCLPRGVLSESCGGC